MSTAAQQQLSGIHEDAANHGMSRRAKPTLLGPRFSWNSLSQNQLSIYRFTALLELAQGV